MTEDSDRPFPATEAIVAFTRAYRIESASADTVARAKHLVLDLLGVTIAATAPGVAENIGRLVTALGQPEGAATVVGSGRIADPEHAALLNGFLSHLLEWDDATLKPIGHPSITILPALFALGEAHGATGRAVLESYLIGLEVHSRLGQAQRKAWSATDPWLPIGHIGLVGAAAAASRLLGLESAQTAHAIGLASHFAGGLGISGGTEAKPFGAGHAARCAVSAVHLAQAGVTACTTSIETAGGFADTFFGSGGHDLEGALGHLGRGELHLDEIGVAIKRYPAVYGTHWSADAMRLLRRTHGLEFADVARVEVDYPAASAFVDNPAPTSPDEARFSLQYLLACCLLHDAPLPWQFAETTIASPAVVSALSKIAARPHAADVQPPAAWAYDVTVHTTDGRVLTAAVPRPHGHPRDPLSALEVEEKFRDAAGDLLGEARTAAVIELVDCLEDLDSIGTLMSAAGAPPDVVSTDVLAGTRTAR